MNATAETERNVLARLLIHPDLFSDSISELQADFFTDERKIIYAVFADMFAQKGKGYDFTTLSHDIPKKCCTEFSLCLLNDSTDQINDDIRILREKAQSRFLVSAVEKVQAATDLSPDLMITLAEKAREKYSMNNSIAGNIIKLSDVQSTKTDWLWYPYIPLGKITIMTADPGSGKTFLSLYLAAQVSTGRPFYGEDKQRTPAVAVYQTAEDGIADTIKPRLECMNPNFDKICIYDESKESLRLSDERIESIMKEVHPRLLIFDPLQAYLGADVDMHRANEVRPVLSKIGALAEKYQCAVILIVHGAKAQHKALYKTLGSIDIPAVARSVLMIVNDPNKAKGRILCHEKSSLAANGQSISFEIVPQFGGVVFTGYSEIKADDVINAKATERKKPSKTRDAVCDSLSELIGDIGYMLVPGTTSLCVQLKCTKDTLNRARKQLGLESKSVGFGKNRKTYWYYPEIDIETILKQSETVNPSIPLS